MGKYRLLSDFDWRSDLISRLNKYIIDYSLDNINLTHDYNNIKSFNIENIVNKSEEKIEIIENNVEKIKVVNKHFSKNNNTIINEQIKNNIHNKNNKLLFTFCNYVYHLIYKCYVNKLLS